MTGRRFEATPEEQEIAEWMVSEVQQNGRLYQERAVRTIASRFGKEFTYSNASGNPAISRRVLRVFNEIKPEGVDWDRWDRSWA